VVGFPFSDSFARKKVANSCVMPWPIPVMSSSNTLVSLSLAFYLPSFFFLRSHSSCSFLARNARLPLANRIQHTTKHTHTHTQSSRYPLVLLARLCIVFGVSIRTTQKSSIFQMNNKRGYNSWVNFISKNLVTSIYCVSVAPSRSTLPNFIFDFLFLPVSLSLFDDDNMPQ
jgi:hypothetical protein